MAVSAEYLVAIKTCHLSSNICARTKTVLLFKTTSKNTTAFRTPYSTPEYLFNYFNNVNAPLPRIKIAEVDKGA